MKTDYAAKARFFSAEDACRVALGAYYAASADNDPPQGETWMDPEGGLWDDGSGFLGWFLYHVTSKLLAENAGNLPPTILSNRPEDMVTSAFRDFVEAAGFLCPEGKDLPPADNRLDNGVLSGVENA